ncbi:MAG TPA: hypothetical protein VGA50_06365, partial [Kiloniellales bacterium]
MAQKDILRALRQEEQELLRELHNLPAFKRLEAIRKVIALYKDAGGLPSPAATVHRHRVRLPKSPTAIIAEAAEEV